jgi:excisionase family DNA binding protein
MTAHQSDQPPTAPQTVVVQLSPLMVDVATAALMLGIGRTAVYEEIRLGRLKAVKRGKSRLIPVKSLNEYVQLLLSEAEEGEAA